MRRTKSNLDISICRTSATNFILPEAIDAQETSLVASNSAWVASKLGGSPRRSLSKKKQMATCLKAIVQGFSVTNQPMFDSDGNKFVNTLPKQDPGLQGSCTIASDAQMGSVTCPQCKVQMHCALRRESQSIRCQHCATVSNVSGLLDCFPGHSKVLPSIERCTSNYAASSNECSLDLNREDGSWPEAKAEEVAPAAVTDRQREIRGERNEIGGERNTASVAAHMETKSNISFNVGAADASRKTSSKIADNGGHVRPTALVAATEILDSRPGTGRFVDSSGTEVHFPDEQAIAYSTAGTVDGAASLDFAEVGHDSNTAVYASAEHANVPSDGNRRDETTLLTKRQRVYQTGLEECRVGYDGCGVGEQQQEVDLKLSLSLTFPDLQRTQPLPQTARIESSAPTAQITRAVSEPEQCAPNICARPVKTTSSKEGVAISLPPSTTAYGPCSSVQNCARHNVCREIEQVATSLLPSTIAESPCSSVQNCARHNLGGGVKEGKDHSANADDFLFKYRSIFPPRSSAPEPLQTDTTAAPLSKVDTLPVVKAEQRCAKKRVKKHLPHPSMITSVLSRFRTPLTRLRDQAKKILRNKHAAASDDSMVRSKNDELSLIMPRFMLISPERAALYEHMFRLHAPKSNLPASAKREGQIDFATAAEILRTINSTDITDAEVNFAKAVQETLEYGKGGRSSLQEPSATVACQIEGMTFKQFVTVAALSEKVARLHRSLRNKIAKMECGQRFCKEIEKARDMFVLCNPSEHGEISLESLEVSLLAARIEKSAMQEISSRLSTENPENLTFLEFLAHIPLFLEIHAVIIDNPIIDDVRPISDLGTLGKLVVTAKRVGHRWKMRAEEKSSVGSSTGKADI